TGTNPSVVMTVSRGGNVGIGTTTPAALLHVTGTTIIQPSTNTTTAFQVQNANGSPIFLVDTTPSYGATTTNYLVNPGFEVNTTGWSASGTGVSIARSTSHKYFGQASLQVNVGTAAGSGVT